MKQSTISNSEINWLLLMIVVDVIGVCWMASSISSDNKPTTNSINTLEQLKQEVISSYLTADREKLKSLMFSDGISKEFTKTNLDTLMTFAGKHRVTESSISPYTGKHEAIVFKGVAFKSKVSPQWMLNVKTEGNEGYEGGKSRFNFQLLIGVLDGKYGLCIGEFDYE